MPGGVPDTRVSCPLAQPGHSALRFVEGEMSLVHRANVPWMAHPFINQEGEVAIGTSLSLKAQLSTAKQGGVS